MSQLRSYHRDVARLISVEVASTELLPVTIAEAKLYSRVDGDVEDSIFDILINSARADFETFTGKLFFQRNVTATFDCEGESLMILPYLPVVSIVSVKKGDDDVEYTLKGDRININTVGEIDVIYNCGLFADANAVETEAKLGALKHIASNYEDRQDVAEISMALAEMPNSSRHHWMRYKNFSL